MSKVSEKDRKAREEVKELKRLSILKEESDKMNEKVNKKQHERDEYIKQIVNEETHEMHLYFNRCIEKIDTKEFSVEERTQVIYSLVKNMTLNAMYPFISNLDTFSDAKKVIETFSKSINTQILDNLESIIKVPEIIMPS